jgi:citronellol/citronellal dehydrogenase
MAPESTRIFAPGLLAGSVCAVSGAGSAVGREIAIELVRLGATVVCCDLRPEPLEAVVAAAETHAGRAEAVATDVRDEHAVGALFDGLLERHGTLDVLVNNPGGEPRGAPSAGTHDDLHALVELDVVGTWLMTHAAATKAFIPQGGGKVLSTVMAPDDGSPAARRSEAPGAAVENMMRTLSIEWARFEIRTCAVAASPSAATEKIAGLIAYLASPAGDFFSGAAITMD